MIYRGWATTEGDAADEIAFRAFCGNRQIGIDRHQRKLRPDIAEVPGSTGPRQKADRLHSLRCSASMPEGIEGVRNGVRRCGGRRSLRCKRAVTWAAKFWMRPRASDVRRQVPHRSTSTMRLKQRRELIHVDESSSCRATSPTHSPRSFDHDLLWRTDLQVPGLRAPETPRPPPFRDLEIARQNQHGDDP